MKTSNLRWLLFIQAGITLLIPLLLMLWRSNPQFGVWFLAWNGLVLAGTLLQRRISGRIKAQLDEYARSALAAADSAVFDTAELLLLLAAICLMTGWLPERTLALILAAGVCALYFIRAFIFLYYDRKGLMR